MTSGVINNKDFLKVTYRTFNAQLVQFNKSQLIFVNLFVFKELIVLKVHYAPFFTGKNKTKNRVFDARNNSLQELT